MYLSAPTHQRRSLGSDPQHTRRWKYLKEIMENDPNFKMIYDRKSGCISSRELRESLHENLPLHVVSEIESAFSEHCSQKISYQSSVRVVEADPSLTRLLPMHLLDRTTEKRTKKNHSMSHLPLLHHYTHLRWIVRSLKLSKEVNLLKSVAQCY